VDTVQVADPHPTSIASAKAHSQQPHARPPAGPRPRETAHGGDPDWRVRNRLPGDSGAPVVSSCCTRPPSLADSRPACDAPPPTAAAPHERRARTQVFPEKKRTGATRRCAGRTCRDATARCSAWGAATSSSRGAPPCTSGPPDPPPPARQARLRHSWAPHARCTWPRSAGARPARPSRRGDGRGYLVPTPRAAGGSRGGEPRMGVP
jgi:hypothetical protein